MINTMALHFHTDIGSICGQKSRETNKLILNFYKE